MECSKENMKEKSRLSCQMFVFLLCMRQHMLLKQLTAGQYICNHAPNQIISNQFLRFAGGSGSVTENFEVLLVCLEARQIFALLSAQMDSKYLLR